MSKKVNKTSSYDESIDRQIDLIHSLYTQLLQFEVTTLTRNDHAAGLNQIISTLVAAKILVRIKKL